MRIAAAVLLLLAGCGQSHTSTSERAEIADVNSRNALEKIAALEARVDELEANASSEAEARKASDASLAKNIDSLAEKHNLVVDQVYGTR